MSKFDIKANLIGNLNDTKKYISRMEKKKNLTTPEKQDLKAAKASVSAMEKKLKEIETKELKKSGIETIHSTSHCKKNLISVNIKKHKDKNGGHPHIIMEDIEDNHVSIGLSTKRTKGKNGRKNYELEKNPLDENKKSYMRRQGTIDKQSSYYSAQKGTITSNDYQQAKIYAGRTKEKYIQKKDKKSNDSANV